MQYFRMYTSKTGLSVSYYWTLDYGGARIVISEKNGVKFDVADILKLLLMCTSENYLRPKTKAEVLLREWANN